MSLTKQNALPAHLIALCVGALLPLAFAPFGYYVLAVVCLALLFYLCQYATGKTSFLRAYLFGLGYFGVGVYWLHISINLFGGMNLAGALFFTYLLVAVLALFPAAAISLANRFFSNGAIYAYPFLWVIAEWLRGWVLTGFPWLNIGTGQTDSLLATYAPVIGDYGLSLLVSLLAAAVVVMISGRLSQRLTAMSLIIVMVISAVVLKQSSWTEASGEELEVALIQGAIPQEIKWQPEQRQQTMATYSELTQPFWSSDLILWPETAIPSLYQTAGDFLQRITRDKGNSDAVFMSGLAYRDVETRDFYNSILVVDEQHRFYHKHQLVPFGEYLPFRRILGNVLDFLQIPMSDFSSGNESLKIIETDKAVLGMSICYEDAYGRQIRNSLPDAEVLINVSNDAWFGDSLAPHQHLQIARMRALENQRYLLRATNTGVSAIIDPLGRIVAQSPQFEPHALAGTVIPLQGATPFSRWGNLPVLLTCGLVLLLLAISRFRKPAGRP